MAGRDAGLLLSGRTSLRTYVSGADGKVPFKASTHNVTTVLPGTRDEGGFGPFPFADQLAETQLRGRGTNAWKHSVPSLPAASRWPFRGCKCELAA